YNVLCDNWLCVVIDFVYQAIDCGCCEGERGMLLLQQRNQNRILTNKKINRNYEDFRDNWNECKQCE
ncbi:hypothetical protein, partial [Sodaliphilus pleomorphus]|uniref:hypothetical protein n=1 Tax=Sodaliphilus pleomorphus TaxID=2606626 RepID=UPI00197CDCA3